MSLKVGDKVNVTGGSYANQCGKITALNGTTQATVEFSDGSGSHRLHLTSLQKATAAAAAAAKSARPAPPASQPRPVVPRPAAAAAAPPRRGMAVVVEPPPCLVDEVESGDSEHHDELGIYAALRGVAVSHLADDVWARRGGRDMYTGRTRRSEAVYQVDHVLEIQLHAFAAQQVLGDANVRNITRAVKHKFRDELTPFASQVQGLNNTDRHINLAKKGPFQRFVHRQREAAASGRLVHVPLEALAGETARNSQAMKEMIDDGTW